MRASDAGGNRRGAGPDLVETRAAIDGSVVPGSERDHRLASAAAADRGVELARSARGSGALGDSPTGRAALGVVEQALAREERLLAAGERELACAVAAGEAAVLEHACLFLLLGAVAPVCVAAPRASWSIRGRRQEGAHRRVEPGSDPELIRAE